MVRFLNSVKAAPPIRLAVKLCDGQYLVFLAGIFQLPQKRYCSAPHVSSALKLAYGPCLQDCWSQRRHNPPLARWTATPPLS